MTKSNYSSLDKPNVHIETYQENHDPHATMYDVIITLPGKAITIEANDKDHANTIKAALTAANAIYEEE